MAIDENGMRCESRAPKVWNGARANASVTGKGKKGKEGEEENDLVPLEASITMKWRS